MHENRDYQELDLSNSELRLPETDANLTALGLPSGHLKPWQEHNHIIGLTELKNQYLGIRHAISEANAGHLVVSNPELACKSCGITAIGRGLFAARVYAAFREGVLRPDAIVLSSDFLRARQSAELLLPICGFESLSFTSALRERFFGDFDKLPWTEYYAGLATLDNQDPFHQSAGVESVVELMKRSTALIAKLEAQFENRQIILLSHHETLQLLREAFAKRYPGGYAQQPSIDNGAVIEFKLGRVND